MKLVTVEEMRNIEKAAFERGMPFEQMMTNAGGSLALTVEQRYPGKKAAFVTGLVGSGNNGGDTLIALTLLQKDGWNAVALLVKERTNDPLVKNFVDAGGKILTAADRGFASNVKTVLRASGVVLDGVLGTGTILPLKDDVKKFLVLVRSELAEKVIVAVDCPSGVDCSSGQAAPETLKADLTICMEAVKDGLMKFPAFEYCGEIVTVEIGLEKEAGEIKPDRMVLDSTWVESKLPKRPMTAHKGTFGTIMVIGGSTNYVGAPLLSGLAAYRSGSGLVTLAVPQSIHPILAGRLAEAIWLLLGDEGGVISEMAAEIVKPRLANIDALVVGPGLGREATTQRFLDGLFLPGKVNGKNRRVGFLVETENGKTPDNKLPKVLIDADGLRWLAELDEWQEKIKAKMILTPHPGEMAALTGLTVEEIQKDRDRVAAEYAKKWNQVVVLKGALSVIAAPDGRTAIVPVASAALAKAGSGDVLSGIITSLVGQGVALFEAACVGAWIHAYAGLRAAEKLKGEVSVIATDLIDAIPQAFSDLK